MSQFSKFVMWTLKDEIEWNYGLAIEIYLEAERLCVCERDRDV